MLDYKDPIVKVEQNRYRTFLLALTISIVLGTSFCCGCLCGFVFWGYIPASTLRDHFIRLEEPYGVSAIKQWLSKAVIVNHCARQSPTYWSIFVLFFATCFNNRSRAFRECMSYFTEFPYIACVSFFFPKWECMFAEIHLWPTQLQTV